MKETDIKLEMPKLIGHKYENKTETHDEKTKKNEQNLAEKEQVKAENKIATKKPPPTKPTKQPVHDHPIFKKVAEGDLEQISNYIEIEGVSIETEDNDGMTPLMYAAWKGQIEVARYLIKLGADPSGGSHRDGYTALHFAALAGQPKIITLLLQAGAREYHETSRRGGRRTPAQMAGFVGHHECVQILNNFVPKEDVYYYTRCQPLEKEPKLPPALAMPVYRLVMMMNTHPVRIAYHFRDNPGLLENITKVRKVLEAMSDKEFKWRYDVNEVLSLKFHIIHYIVKDMEKNYLKMKETCMEEQMRGFLDKWIQSLLAGREEDGFPVYMENFLRQGIRQFPFQESQLFKMIVMSFGHHKMAKKIGEGPKCADAINDAFNGQKGFKDYESCDSCSQEKAKKCANCKQVDYCDQLCQKYHWPVHRKYCAKERDKMEKRMAATAKWEAERPEREEKQRKEEEEEIRKKEELQLKEDDSKKEADKLEIETGNPKVEEGKAKMEKETKEIEKVNEEIEGIKTEGVNMEKESKEIEKVYEKIKGIKTEGMKMEKETKEIEKVNREIKGVKTE